MAYFPNGTAGMDFQARFCDRCANADKDGMCAIWDAHMIYNYDQLDAGQEKLHGALSMLIDDDAGCRLFRK
jgi:hypothetical protein